VFHAISFAHNSLKNAEFIVILVRKWPIFVTKKANLQKNKTHMTKQKLLQEEKNLNKKI
jgi:hypothetical protein